MTSMRLAAVARRRWQIVAWGLSAAVVAVFVAANAHLVAVAPAGHQVRLLEQGRVQQMRHAAQPRRGIAAHLRVGQVQRQVGHPCPLRRRSARER